MRLSATPGGGLYYAPSPFRPHAYSPRSAPGASASLPELSDTGVRLFDSSNLYAPPQYVDLIHTS
jgi:hypothetical protein